MEATTSLPPDARIAIARLEKAATTDATPATLAAAGVGYLVAGEVDRAITTLEEAATVGKHAAAWSDLSAAYLVKAQRAPARRVEHLARALEAASRSLEVASTNEARFNRALAIEGLLPYLGATDAWLNTWRRNGIRSGSASPRSVGCAAGRRRAPALGCAVQRTPVTPCQSRYRVRWRDRQALSRSVARVFRTGNADRLDKATLDRNLPALSHTSPRADCSPARFAT